MGLLLLAFLGGVLTILSPCILPVLPFVFARADQSFRKSGLPLLAGMAITFVGLAAVATTAGTWIVQANQYGRIVAMVVLFVLGLTLVSDSLADLLTRPFARFGGKLSGPAGVETAPSASRSFVLGIATGFLWAPCAGPVLGLILTGAAVEGASTKSTFLLLAYAAGAATSLAIALLAGAKVFGALKRSLGAEVWIRRILGVAVLAGVAAVALGLDRGVLTQLSLANTSDVEQSLVNRLRPAPETTAGNAPGAASDGLQRLPELTGVTQWLNSKPLTAAELKGKVVLIDFWTYSCINCLRTLPYVKAWAERYKDSGLVVIGVHTPEFAFEKDEAEVRRAINELKIPYPVAMDNDYAIWKAFDNKYWPADYLVDVNGNIRHHNFGEGNYAETEKHIQELLKERDGQISFNDAVKVAGTGAEAAPNSDVQSMETYVGYERADGFASPGGFAQDEAHAYTTPAVLQMNHWGLVGKWTDTDQSATLNAAPDKIVYRFHARDLHLVLGPSSNGKPVRFRVKLDGKAPGENHGADTDAQGVGMVNEHRLYQLIRQTGKIEDHTFEIEFLDPGLQAFAFTFG